MPTFQIQTSTPAPAPPGLLKGLSALLARELSKPESYVMVSFQGALEMSFGGTLEPACFATLKSIGTFTPAQTEKLSALLTRELSGALGVAPSRIYLEFVNAQDYLWGHDGSTFA